MNELRFEKDVLANVIPIDWIVMLACFALCGTFLGSALSVRAYNNALFGVMALWVIGIIYSLVDIKKRFLLFFMEAMVFVFLLSRPFIGMFRGTRWWHWSHSSVTGALLSIFLSLAFLLIGSKLIEDLPERKTKGDPIISSGRLRLFSTVLLILLCICGLVHMYTQGMTYLNMRGMSYELYYTSARTSFSAPVNILSSIYPYITFAYLALMPEKRRSYLVCCLYILTGIPVFLIGNRSSLVVKLVYVVIYLCIRNEVSNKGRKWFTKQMTAILVVLAAAGVVFLGTYNYTRTGADSPEDTPLDSAVDFFYRQGTSFDTVCSGFEYERGIKNLPGAVNYTFGDLIDGVQHSFIGRRVFGTSSLSSTNSIQMVEESNSLAHRLSYIVLGEGTYLAGHGRGSSYILEAYMDGGYLGVVVYSLLLGMFLSSVIRLMRKGSIVLNYTILAALSRIAILPRSSASSFLTFLITPYFWFVIVLLFFVREYQKYSAVGRFR